MSPAPSPPQLVHPTLGWPRVMAYALPGNVSALELSRDGGAMVVASAAADAVRVFDLRRGVVRAAGRLGKVHGVLRAEGTLEVVPHEGRWRAQVAPWTTPEQAGGGAPGAPAPPRIAGPPVDLRNLPTCVDFTLDPPLMALVWRRSHVQLHGPGEDEPRWVHHSGVRSLVPLTRLLPGGERLLLAWRDGAELVVQLLDTRAVELVLAERLDGRAGAPVEPLASWASADGRRAWVRDSSGVVALDVAAGALLSQARSDAFTRALALHPDGEHLARLLEDGRLRLERREDGEVVAGAARSLDTPAMAFGPTGRDLYVAEGGFVRALDADQLFAC